VIKVFVDNIFYTNTYLIIEGGKCIIIDPGFSTRELIEYIKDNKIKPLSIIATHGHIDHVWGVNKIREYYGIPFYMSFKDLKLAFPPIFKNILGDFKVPDADYDLKEGSLMMDDFRFYVIETPGHTMGSVSIKYRSIVFTGDTLFKESIGRTDLGGDINLLVKSIHSKLFKLSPSTKVYPGHGEHTTIGYEMLHNPYVGREGIYPYEDED